MIDSRNIMVNIFINCSSHPSRGDTSTGSVHIIGGRSEQHRSRLGISTDHWDGCVLAERIS